MFRNIHTLISPSTPLAGTRRQRLMLKNSQFYLAYRSLCPSAWCQRWDDQRENGTFPTRLDQ